MSSRTSTRLAVVRPTRRGGSHDWRRPAVRNRGVCGSTSCNTRWARITSQSSRSGRAAKRSTRTPPLRTPGSTATHCSRCPAALSMSACTNPLNRACSHFSDTLLETSNLEPLHPLPAVFRDIDIAPRVDGDAVRLVELTGEVADAPTEARQDLAGLAVDDFDLRIILVDEVHEPLV